MFGQRPEARAQVTRPFVIDLGWRALLGEMGTRPADLLRSASLAEDLFSRERPTLSPEAFRRLFDALSRATRHDAPGLVVGQSISSEALNPPILAAFCSETLVAATERLARYKPLTGPVRLEAHAMTSGLELTFQSEPDVVLPDEYIAAELVSLVSLARRATGRGVRPIAVEMVNAPVQRDYAAFFGHPVYSGPFNRVVFAPEDAHRPLLSPDPGLFRQFDPDLRPRLDELDRTASVTDRVRSALMETVPAGRPDIGTVARRLGMSARTLQRRLGAEDTAFQEVLQDLRERLARGYLKKTALTSSEISFLLGYDDPNSFTRAFHYWTGTTPEAFRAGA